ncbi:MAG: hypothetical protein C4306_11075 [Thermoleophilia bacterium]
MTVRRTTVAADSADLLVLDSEAQRRGVSLAQVLREIVAREAIELRRRHRSRFGIGRPAAGIAQLAVNDEESPARGRLRS